VENTLKVIGMLTAILLGLGLLIALTYGAWILVDGKPTSMALAMVVVVVLAGMPTIALLDLIEKAGL
jgi:membrane protein YdbS with pleckstrin-like domain